MQSYFARVVQVRGHMTNLVHQRNSLGGGNRMHHEMLVISVPLLCMSLNITPKCMVDKFICFGTIIRLVRCILPLFCCLQSLCAALQICDNSFNYDRVNVEPNCYLFIFLVTLLNHLMIWEDRSTRSSTSFYRSASCMFTTYILYQFECGFENAWVQF